MGIIMKEESGLLESLIGCLIANRFANQLMNVSELNFNDTVFRRVSV